MKQILLGACLCLFLFAKCKKDSTEPEGNYFGYAKADINGVTVNFNKVRGGLLYNLDDSISLSLEKWDGLLFKEQITFQKLFKWTINPQRIYKFPNNINRIQKLSSAYYTLSNGGDVICDVYDNYEPDSLQNYITITSFNSQTNEIRGTFQATYLIEMPKCRTAAPDTLRIRNGEFYTKIF
jgi:hypothetical protein